jgi:hypothetical protein
MAIYRCYLLSQDSHIAAVEVFECHDDKGARSTAHTLARSRQYAKAEVWDRDRLVARIERVLSG